MGGVEGETWRKETDRFQKRSDRKKERGSPPLRWGGFKGGDEEVGSRAEWNYERRDGQKDVRRRWLIGLRLGGGWRG